MTNETPKSEIVFYQTEDGRTRVQCRFENETIWLTQKLMAELFQKDVRTINEHIQTIIADKELSMDSVIRKFRITAADGKNYETLHYSLEMILAVGYRVRSPRGTQFRQWASPPPLLRPTGALLTDAKSVGSKEFATPSL